VEVNIQNDQIHRIVAAAAQLRIKATRGINGEALGTVDDNAISSSTDETKNDDSYSLQSANNSLACSRQVVRFKMHPRVTGSIVAGEESVPVLPACVAAIRFDSVRAARYALRKAPARSP